MTLLEQRIDKELCACCGEDGIDEEEPLSIHEFRDLSGREVSICNECGNNTTPTLTELWDAIEKARHTRVGKWVRK